MIIIFFFLGLWIENDPRKSQKKTMPEKKQNI
jgi:hypothetical protein